MVDNPYAPPKAPVADIQLVPTEPPDQVVTACRFFWASFAASTLLALTEITRAANTAQVIGVLIGTVIGGLISGLITWWIVSKLQAGRNWMRLLLTIIPVVVLVSVPVFWSFYQDAMARYYSGAPLRVVWALVQSGLGLWSLVLINTANSRAWFQLMKRTSHRAA